ncbi:LytR/AlgR family response regulator transcription factor [Flavobacterium sp. ZB4R12]|uniref:LytR/AlgR family response regulator transcription factor n=1 Tax=Flavobacterium sp. ZB4R12 TaxID=3398732 RepID=UPI003AAAFAFB
MYKCLIIDDEVPARALIANHLSNLPDFEIINSFDNAIEAFVFLQQNEVDLIFLDVQMPRMSGLELLKSLNKKPKVILTTAYRDYAVEGFELEVFDYLLKPISQERFLKSISRFINSESNMNQLPNVEAQNELFISLKVGKENKQVNVNNIYFIEGLKDYIKIATTEGILVVYERLRTMEKILPESRFFRIHKSFIVAKEQITNWNTNSVTVNNRNIPIGRTYKNDFLERVKY